MQGIKEPFYSTWNTCSTLAIYNGKSSYLDPFDELQYIWCGVGWKEEIVGVPIR